METVVGPKPGTVTAVAALSALLVALSAPARADCEGFKKRILDITAAISEIHREWQSASTALGQFEGRDALTEQQKNEKSRLVASVEIKSASKIQLIDRYKSLSVDFKNHCPE